MNHTNSTNCWAMSNAARDPLISLYMAAEADETLHFDFIVGQENNSCRVVLMVTEDDKITFVGTGQGPDVDSAKRAAAKMYS